MKYLFQTAKVQIILQNLAQKTKKIILLMLESFFITPDMKYAYMRVLSAPFSLRRDRETLRRCIIRGIT